MTIVRICNIDVNFPFEPYDVQKEYMTKVIQCLQSGNNGILESPTGTGKTLCLLCAASAWLVVQKAQAQAYELTQRSEDPDLNELQFTLNNAAGVGWAGAASKIIYTSRTHSQLTQAVQEFSRTSYNFLRTTVLGSRQQLCILPEVLAETSNSAQVHLCQAKTKSKTCHFYNNLETKQEDLKNRKDCRVLDIEDLVTMGKKEKFCPYFMARELKTVADIIFMPYNYILDPKSRQAQGIDLQDSVIIIDEAHNIESVCEETASCQLRLQDVAACISETTQLMTELQELNLSNLGNDDDMHSPFTFSFQDLVTIKTICLALEEQVSKVTLPPDPLEGAVFDGSYIFDILQSASINENNADTMLEVLGQLITQLADSSRSGPFHHKGNGLQKLLEFLNVVFNKDIQRTTLRRHASVNYKVHICEEEQKRKGNVDLWSIAKSSKTPRVLSYWCFCPGFSMKALAEQKVRSIIVTSGTLHPLNTFTAELQIPFPIRLQNPHIIKKEQIWVGVITKGPDGHVLNSSYGNRTDQFIDSLGRAILNITRMVPDGMLVFFPSYAVMKSCLSRWEDSTAWQAMSQQKTVLMEPQTKDEFQSTISQFYEAVNSPSTKGAIFLAVFRGKVSEGLDFIDMNGRAVIIAGIPYAQFKDPRVKLKKEYLDNLKKNQQTNKRTDVISGHDWYRLQATRAVNQAVGRIIRHKDDYGAILFCDERFMQRDIQQDLSMWIRPYLKRYDNFGLVVKGLSDFFRYAVENLPQPSGSKKVKPKASAQKSDADNLAEAKAASQKSLFPESISSYFNKTTHKRVEYEDCCAARNGAEDEMLLTTSYLSAGSSSASSSTSASIGQQSCLDALENSKPTISNYPKFAPITQIRDRIEAFRKAKESQVNVRKKRKIVIIEREKSGNEIPANQDAAKKQAVHEQHRRLTSYLAEVKTALTVEKYKLFSSTVKSYHMNKTSFTDTISVIIGIFSEQPENVPLIYKFRALVAEANKSSFDKTMADMKLKASQ